MFINAGHSSTYKHLGAMRGEPAHLKGITQDEFKGSQPAGPPLPVEVQRESANHLAGVHQVFRCAWPT
jgi:hypothetical protein